jgi:opacity protein-like surface antigen
MKRFLATLVLTCALSGVALSADMPTCGAPAPASVQSSSVTTTVILTIISLVIG